MSVYVFAMSTLAVYALAFNFEDVLDFVRRWTRKLTPAYADYPPVGHSNGRARKKVRRSR